MRKEKNTNKILKKITIALFLVVLIVPGIITISGVENKEINQGTEEITAENLRELPETIESNFNKNFGAKETLIKTNSQLQYQIFKTSSKQQIIIGKNDWLFFAGESAPEISTGKSKYSDEQLRKIKNVLLANKKWFDKQGIKFYVVVVPNKHTAYSEFLPINIKQISPFTITDQFVDMFEKDELAIVDLRGELIDKKNIFPTYYNTDSHWNNYGAYVGYKEILRKLKEDNPRLILNEKNFDFEIKSLDKGLPLARRIFLEDIIIEENHAYITNWEEAEDYEKLVRDLTEVRNAFDREGENPNGPRVLALRDSFTTALIPYFTQSFSETRYIWQYSAKKQDILSYDPDIVLLIFVERKISNAVPYVLRT